MHVLVPPVIRIGTQQKKDPLQEVFEDLKHDTSGSLVKTTSRTR